TVITSCLYYINYFDAVPSVVESFDDDAASIIDAKNAIKSPKVKNELLEVKYYLSLLPNAIKKLEKRHKTLDNTLQTIQTIIGKLDQYEKATEKNQWKRQKVSKEIK